MRQSRAESGLVLETKLLAPAARPGWVERPALAYELERGAAARLTLVSAPVGSGKSTLLAQWAATSYDRDVAWLTSMGRRLAGSLLGSTSSPRSGQFGLLSASRC